MLLLSAASPQVKEHAATSMSATMTVGASFNNDGVIQGNFDGGHRAHRARDAVVRLGGAAAVVALVRSDNPAVLRAGVLLLLLLSNGQAEVVRSAGGVPVVVALLATARDAVLQAQAAGLLGNIASLGSAGRQSVLESGGLATVLPLLQSSHGPTQANATALCAHFASDLSNTSAIIDSGGVQALVTLVQRSRFDPGGVSGGAGTGGGGGDGGSGTCAHAATALAKLLCAGPREKALVIGAGAVEALLSLEARTHARLAIHCRTQQSKPQTLHVIFYSKTMREKRTTVEN